MRDALTAIAPIVEKVGILHAEGQAYDEWEDLEAQIFASIMGEPIELAGASRLAKYGFNHNDYSRTTFVNVQTADHPNAALISFTSGAAPFDSLRVAVLDPTTLAAVGEGRVGFETAQFSICVDRQGARQIFKQLSY